jgi:uptake hydrogenase large subunit
MGPEGELRVRLTLSAGATARPRVKAVQITSTRPDVAGALLPGRSRAELRQLMPQLFSVCAAAQTVACELAWSAASGMATSAAELQRAEQAASAEAWRENAWRWLLGAAAELDEEPAADAVAAARAVLQAPHTAADGVAQAVFGVSATSWLDINEPPALRAWADAGATASARLLRLLMHDTQRSASAPGAAAAPRLLPATDHARWLPAWAQQLHSTPQFARAPRWQGHCAETGALARQQGDALVKTLLHPPPGGLGLARSVARLRELARQLCGLQRMQLGALKLAPSTGLAWVDTPRGLLVHWVQLDGEHVQRYAIVAPTDWNFHPRGVLTQALPGLMANELPALRSVVQRYIASLDPCVACRVEFDHA